MILNEHFEESSTIRIVHIASFYGNLGDAASHIGLYTILRNMLSCRIDIKQIEIRRFYQNYSLSNKLYFDQSFVENVNKYDFLIIGGGGFLDYWVPNSITGTTIDISQDNLRRLRVPTFLFSLGCIPHKDIPVGNVEKLHCFLQGIQDNEYVSLAVRNDGSINEIERLFGKNFSSKFYSILDNGFFYQPQIVFKDLISKPYIAINFAVDQLYMNNRLLSKINPEAFQQEMINFIQMIIDNTDYNIVLVPHIYNDTAGYVTLLKRINDYYIRKRIAIAPYLQGIDGCNLLFSFYSHAECIIGMRYHANVCNVALRNRIIGLAALDRVLYMYSSIDMGNNTILADRPFSEAILSRILAQNYQYSGDKLCEKKGETKEIYKRLFEKFGLPTNKI